jgi:hypothetical protein
MEDAPDGVERRPTAPLWRPTPAHGRIQKAAVVGEPTRGSIAASPPVSLISAGSGRVRCGAQGAAAGGLIRRGSGRGQRHAGEGARERRSRRRPGAGAGVRDLVDSMRSCATRSIVESAASKEATTSSLDRKRSLVFPPSLFNNY